MPIQNLITSLLKLLHNMTLQSAVFSAVKL